MQATNDFESLFTQAREQGRATISRTSLSGEQSKHLTILAEQRGFVVFKENDSSRKPFLILTLSREEHCDPLLLTPAQLKLFSDYCNAPFYDPATLVEDMKLFGVAPESLTPFVDEVKRYGIDGLKRRNIILEQEIVSHLQQQPEYKKYLANTPERIGQLDPSMSIMQKVYNKSNENRLFFSIDLKSAVFNCYKQLNIIKTKSWAEFVSQFTPSVSFAASKPARLHIFGELDKNRTNIILWNNALWNVWQNILQHWPQAANHKVAIEGDEIILSTTDEEIVSNAHSLLHDCGLENISDKINIQCYRLIPHEIDVPNNKPDGRKGMKKDKFFIRQKIDLKTGKPTGQFDVKCIQKQNRKQAMLASKALLGL